MFLYCTVQSRLVAESAGGMTEEGRVERVRAKKVSEAVGEAGNFGGLG